MIWHMICMNQKKIFMIHGCMKKVIIFKIWQHLMEKYCGKSIFKVIEESDDDLKETLIELYKVYCLTLIKEIIFFIKENLINKKSYEKINEELNLNNKLLAQKSLI